MKTIFKFALLSLVFSLTFSCFEDNDDSISGTTDIKNFVWNAMNFAYLYKDNSPNLADDRFGSDNDYQSFLNGYESPETLFESLVYDRENIDRFSWITSDYITLEQQFSGVTKTNGAEFNFFYTPGSTTMFLELCVWCNQIAMQVQLLWLEVKFSIKLMASH